MKSNWEKITLGEVAEKIAMGPFGSNIKVSTFVKKGIPIISGQHLRESRLLDHDFNFITSEHADRLRNSIVHRGDVIFTHAGSIGQVSLIPENSEYEEYIISQRQFYLRCNRKKLDPLFATYYFHSRIGQHQLLANRSQTGVPSIARPSTHLKSIEIILPPLDEQRSIAAVLSSLDDKIELLRAQNKTLEEMAQRLFKEWFVDFNFPNEDGKPYKKSGGRMVGSELGEIPEGWRVETFSNLVDVLSGGTPKTTMPTYWNGSIPFFTPKDAKDTFFVATTEKTITEDGLEHCNSKLYPKETVFITARGTVGKCALALSDMAMNQSCYALVGKDVSNLFVFLLTKQIIDLIKKSASGAVFDAITVSTFESLRFPLGDSSVVDQLEKIIRPMFSKISDNTEETNILSELRDQLLPKLMSGDLMTF